MGRPMRKAIALRMVEKMLIEICAEVRVRCSAELWFGVRVSGEGRVEKNVERDLRRAPRSLLRGTLVRVSGFRFRVSGFGFRALGVGFRVSSFGFRGSG